MKRYFLCSSVAACLAATCLFPAHAATAADMKAAEEIKPIVVGSFAGYDALFDDINTLGKVSGNPDLASGLEAMLKFATRSHGLSGLNKSKPWGVAVYPTECKPSVYAFLPVDDLDKLLAVLEPFVGKPESVGDGVMKLEYRNNKGKKRPLFVTQKGVWTVVSKKQENLALAPENPGELLGDLPQNYDLAVRIAAADIPPALREKFIAKMQKDVQKDIERRSGEDEIEYAVRKQVTKEILKNVEGAINDLERITLGWTLDNKSEKTYVDLIILARPGSEMQKQLARWNASKTRFAGFRAADAALACSWCGELTDSEAETIKSVLDGAHAKAVEDIEKQGKSKEHRSAAKAFVADLFDLMKANVDSKRFDGGISLLLAPDAATLLAGKHVPNAAALENMARRFVDMAVAEHPELERFFTIKPDVEEYMGVRLHAVSVPIPDDVENRERITALVGETLEAVVGVGEDAVYLAAGREPLAALKKAIDASAEQSESDVPPLQITIDLRSLAGLLAEVAKSEDQRAKAAALAQILSKADDQDHLVFTAAAVENGLRLRLEVQSGIVKAAGAMSTLLSADLMTK